jgi:ligand-binding sensor domain-containing protein
MTEALLPMSGTPLANADIRCLLDLIHGQSEYLWVGTNAGLYCGPPSELQKLPDLAGRAISALLWDSRHHIVWIGTDKGLFSLIKRAANEWVIAQELTSDNSGLAADRVTALMLSNDAQGKQQLWIGTPCGLSRYSY